MKKKIAVLSCGWCNDFVREFLNGMRKATAEKDIDIYVFNAYNYTEFSGFPNFTGFSIFSLINYEDYDGIVVLSIISLQIVVKSLERGSPLFSLTSPAHGDAHAINILIKATNSGLSACAHKSLLERYEKDLNSRC